jgi:hypothetical protein
MWHDEVDPGQMLLVVCSVLSYLKVLTYQKRLLKWSATHPAAKTEIRCPVMSNRTPLRGFRDPQAAKLGLSSLVAIGRLAFLGHRGPFNRELPKSVCLHLVRGRSAAGRGSIWTRLSAA